MNAHATRPAKPRAPLLRLVAAFALCASTMGANGMGCGEGLQNRPGEPGLDVGGINGATWAMTYNPQIEVTVKGTAGVISRKLLPFGAGSTFVVGTKTINLVELCNRGDVACPNDVLPAAVRMTQPSADRHFLQVTINTKGPLGKIQQAVLPGNVDSDNDFSVFLGVTAAAAGPCGLLGVSYATGQIRSDALNAARGVSLTGDIVTGYSGGCLIGDPNAAGAAGVTVELRQSLVGVRGGL